MRYKHTSAFCIIILVATIGQGAEKLKYNKDIRPILSENCFACHGPDSAARKADLRLDKREDAIKFGAIVAGNAEKSPIIERIFSAEKSKVMPPPKAHKVLTTAQKEILKRWVLEGAEYELHWSFIAAKKPNLPEIKNPAWVKNPIDRFILAELEKKGLAPAPEADRRTLARRLSLDLNGLPPDPAVVEAFVADKRPDAYEKLVDQFMQSSSWGEHRGRIWLDAARYADSHGIHFDNYREMWSYRDWVINAFNKNMPFAQFTIEQLAGDLLPNATLQQKIASGFNRCNITTNEGGAISEEYLVLYTRDRTETVAQVWLGLTAGCAVCHDHKFDPFSTKDFYSMAAFFNNTTQGAMDGNIKDTPPIIAVPSPEDQARWEVVSKELASVRTLVENRKKESKGDFEKWMATANKDTFSTRTPTEGLEVSAALKEGKGNKLEFIINKEKKLIDAPDIAWVKGQTEEKVLQVAKAGSVTIPEIGDFEKDQAFSFGAWVLTPRQQFGPLFARMDDTAKHRGWDLWFENGKVGAHLVSSWPENAIKVMSKASFNQNVWTHVFVTYNGSGKADGVKIYVNGTAQATEVLSNNLTGSIRTKVPFRLGSRHSKEPLQKATFHDLKIYNRNLRPEEVAALGPVEKLVQILAKEQSKRTPEEVNQLFDWWLSNMDEKSKDLAKRLGNLDREEKELKGKGTIAHIMVEKPEPSMAYILNRGDYDKRKDKVAAATPEILPTMPKDSPKNRLGFSQWLLMPENPLTYRVTVNRFWQEVFGNGLVRSSGDFGITGDTPSHPELLDYLAIEFREQGGDIKKFFKLMVTSATYMQSAAATPEKLEKDPANRLLSRGSRYRMDAEMIRDYALASSGIMTKKIGGPSVKPYQPEGVWEAVAMIGSNTRDYRPDSGENLYRKSMYTFWKRSAPPASMEILNAPNRETCTVKRERTNTPLQALVTLNDPQFVEAARFLAERTLKEGGPSLDSQLDFITMRILSRKLNPAEKALVLAERSDLLGYYSKNQEEAKKLQSFGAHKSDPKLDLAELSTWTMTINSLMNLDEVLCR
jgi:Protein of unknown function (DUF1553)/Protein of unknown function (DUF1549)/Concanavalin A-like lectin/glucanases superfamily/Planctomycete cytochrome C